MLFAETNLFGVAAIIGATLSGIPAIIAAVYAFRSHSKVIAVKEDVALVKTDLHKVEVATNSMKDAQVAMASKLGMAEGELKGRADLKAEQAVPPLSER